MELTYTIRGEDGKEYGPANLEQLILWTREGRVQSHSDVKRSDMGHWSLAGSFAELRSVFTSAPGVVPQGAPAAAQTSTDAVAAARLRSAASWFYWIAGLSLINSISALSGSDWRFIFGLGITQILDAFGEGFGAGGKVVALVLNLIVAGVFVLFGVFAHKKHSWAFVTGMVLFALDGLIFVLAQDWLGVGFHAFVLFILFRGIQACRALKAA
jgi:hypothetical protein